MRMTPEAPHSSLLNSVSISTVPRIKSKLVLSESPSVLISEKGIKIVGLQFWTCPETDSEALDITLGDYAVQMHLRGLALYLGEAFINRLHNRDSFVVNIPWHLRLCTFKLQKILADPSLVSNEWMDESSFIPLNVLICHDLVCRHLKCVQCTTRLGG